MSRKDHLNFYLTYNNKYFDFVRRNIKTNNDIVISDKEDIIISDEENEIWLHPIVAIDFARFGSITEIESEIIDMFTDVRVTPVVSKHKDDNSDKCYEFILGMSVGVVCLVWLYNVSI
jgi:hypothetical protein